MTKGAFLLRYVHFWPTLFLHLACITTPVSSVVCSPLPQPLTPPSHVRPQTRDALATASLADLNSYTKRFARLAGPGSGEIDLPALLHHFDSELLTGTALQRILEHVGVAGVAHVTRGQFLAVAHLVCTVLQQVQQALFEGEASDGSLASPTPAAKHASPATSQHSCIARRRTASGPGANWSIRAERGAARGARRTHHPTVAELLSQAGAEEGSQAPSCSAVGASGDEADPGFLMWTCSDAWLSGCPAVDGARKRWTTTTPLPPSPLCSSQSDEGSRSAWQAFSGSLEEVSSASLDWECVTPTSRPLDLWSQVVERPGAPAVPRGSPQAAAPPGARTAEEGAIAAAAPREDWTAFESTSPIKALRRAAPPAPVAPITVPRPAAPPGLEVMSDADRLRCEQLYDRKVRRGGGTVWCRGP